MGTDPMRNMPLINPIDQMKIDQQIKELLTDPFSKGRFILDPKERQAFYDKQIENIYGDYLYGPSYSKPTAPYRYDPVKNPFGEGKNQSKRKEAQTALQKHIAQVKEENYKKYCENGVPKAKDDGKWYKNIIVYYGNFWGTEKPSDLNYSDKNKEDLLNTKHISKFDLESSEREHIANWKSLARTLSSGDMQDVVIDMIDHFLDGSGTDYSNDTLTQIVKEHKVTQQFMSDFTNQFNEMMKQTNGDYESFANSEEFKNLLRDNKVYISTYSYGGGLLDKDTYGGLTMAIHGWTEVTVTLTNFNKTGNSYSGNLQFTFSDNFGLDESDIEEFGALAGFRSWYVLQHYDEYNHKYKPFKTKVTIDYAFSGSL